MQIILVYSLTMPLHIHCSEAFKKTAIKLKNSLIKENTQNPKSIFLHTDSNIILPNEVVDVCKIIPIQSKLYILYLDNQTIKSNEERSKNYSEKMVYSLFKVGVVDINSKNFNEEAFPKIKDITDIAGNKEHIVIAHMTQNQKKSLLNSDENRSEILLKDISRNQEWSIPNAHATVIKSIFIDDTFIVSHSKAKKARFWDIESIKNPQTITKNGKEIPIIKPLNEITLGNVLNYKDKCLIYEGFINNKTLTYLIDKKAEANSSEITVAESYNKQSYTKPPCLTAINNQGDAIVYDQRNRSLNWVHFNKKNSPRFDFLPSGFEYDTQNTFYLNSAFRPPFLAHRVAQHVHYINNTDALLIYDNMIVYCYTQDQKNSLLNGVILKDKITKHSGILATAIQDTNALWLALKDANNTIQLQKITLSLLDK